MLNIVFGIQGTDSLLIPEGPEESVNGPKKDFLSIHTTKPCPSSLNRHDKGVRRGTKSEEKKDNMKTTTAVKWIVAVLLAASWTANAQGPGGGGGGQSESGGQHQRLTPEQMAQHLMEKFDANKDGVLSQDELTLALEALQKNHPHGAGGGSAGASQGGQGNQYQEPPPADKVAAQMIEKFSSDKKGLTQAELAKALEERRANRRQHGEKGQEHGSQSTPPPQDGSDNQQ